MFFTAQANHPLIISADLTADNHSLVAGALCNVVNDSHLNTACFTLPAKTAKQNIQRLTRGQAQLAIISADHYYYHKQRHTNLMPLMGLYTETLLIVVRENSNIHTLNDLKKHTVNLGEESSSTWLAGKKILQTAGIGLTDLSSVSLTNSLDPLAKEAFCYGNIDALFLLDSTPSTHMREIISACPVRVLSIPADITEELIKNHPYFDTTTVRQNTYYDIPEVQTIGINAFLVTHRDSFTNQQGYNLTKLLVSQLKTLRKYAPTFSSTDSNILTSPSKFCELQPGAGKYFKTQGIQ